MPKAVLLTNSIPPYRIELFQSIAELYDDFSVWVDVDVESDRLWKSDLTSCSFRVCRSGTVSIPRRITKDAGRDLHLPVLLLLKLLRDQPNVIITSELGARTIIAAFASLLLRAELIVWLGLSEHTERRRGAVRTWVRRWIFQKAHRIVVHGRSAERYVVSVNAMSGSKVRRVPQAVPQGVASPTPAQSQHARSSDPSIVFVGTATPRKNLAKFMEDLAEWSRLRGAHPELIIVGAIRDNAVKIYLTHKYSLRFVGNVAHDQVSALIRQSDVLVLPTLADEWGLVVNEALCVGVPVLGSIYSQAVNELIIDGVNGWVFDPLRQQEVFSALDAMRSWVASPLDRSEEVRATVAGVTITAMAGAFASSHK